MYCSSESLLQDEFKSPAFWAGGAQSTIDPDMMEVKKYIYNCQNKYLRSIFQRTHSNQKTEKI